MRTHTRGRLWPARLRGAAAGAFGTVALSVAADPLARFLLGREAVYSPTRIARRAPLVRELAKRIGARRAGRALRWAYGPGLAAAYGLVRSRASSAKRRGPSLAGALVLASAVYGFERFALPLTGATKPLDRWPKSDRLLLPLHTLTFGLATEIALGWLRIRASRTPKNLAGPLRRRRERPAHRSR